MSATEHASGTVAGAGKCALAAPLWSRFACARCRYRWERPGTPQAGDLDRDCPLCRGQLRAVTVYRVGEAGGEQRAEDGG